MEFEKVMKDVEKHAEEGLKELDVKKEEVIDIIREIRRWRVALKETEIRLMKRIENIRRTPAYPWEELYEEKRGRKIEEEAIKDYPWEEEER
jgi:hypothetical protein